MEFKGTSGKWTIYLDKFKKLNTGLFRVPIISKYGSEFNYGYYNAHCFGRNEEQCKYNALLISKAPEMLELLQSLVSSEMTPLTIRKQAKQLIKEATEL